MEGKSKKNSIVRYKPCEAKCQFVRGNSVYAKHAVEYRDYRHCSVMYYTSWKYVSSPKQSLPLFSSTRARMMIVLAKPSSTILTTIRGREGGRGIICPSHIITATRTINRFDEMNCVGQILFDWKLGMRKKESPNSKLIIFTNYHRESARITA